MKTCAQCQIKYPDALDYCPQDGQPLPPTASQTQALYDAYLGTTIDGRYMIEAKLGEGGMGVVYAARHVIIDKRVAIKILKKEAQEEETAGQRFIQEAKSASSIGHANIVDITDFGTLPDGSAYFVMEFLEGQTLGQAIAQGPLESRRVVTIAAQIARGLNAAHGKGIIHRDLKPENIFILERDGHSDVVKIVDFGIAKVQSGGMFGPTGGRLTQVGMVLGTPEYMSPEQATGKDTDHRVDEYALGCMMYEMITGEVPFRGETSAGTLTKHVFDTAKAPRALRPELPISPALEAVTLKAMAKKPDDRYPGMRELLDALDVVGAEIDSGMDASRVATARSERNRVTMIGSRDSGASDEVPARSGRGVAIAVVIGGLVLVGALGGWVAFGRKASSGEAALVVQEIKSNGVNPTAAPPDPSAAVPTAPKVTPTVNLTLRSNPGGAEVFVGPEKIGVAPVNYSHLASNAPVAFTFKLPGYKESTRDVVPDENRDIEVPLMKHEAHSSRRSSQRSVALPKGPSSEASRAPPTKPKQNGELRDPF